MNDLLPVFESATVVWEQSLLGLNGYHFLLAAAYGVAAWLCLLNATLARQAEEPARPWWVATVLLGLLAANTLLHADVFATELIRATARMELWYGARRSIQYEVDAALLLFLGWILLRLRRAFTASGVASEPVAYGILLLVLLLGVRLVSAHGTDAVLNLRLAGVSMGRMLELAGIGLVVYGARRCLRLR